MIESFITWLAGLPPGAVYLVIAVLAFIENIIPPFPSDVAIALGAFLSHREITNPWLVYGVTIVANTAGAAVMYRFVLRHSDRLFSSKFAQRVLPIGTLSIVEKEYTRWGLLGIFIGRLLPGVRAMVAPFAGLVRLGWWQAMIPITIASAIWYAAIIFGAAKVGRHFTDVQRVLGEMNRTLLVVAVLVIVGLGFAIWSARHRKSREV